MSFFQNKNFLEIGPFTITMYAFCIMLGVLVGGVLSIKEGKKLGVPKEKIIDGIMYGLPLGIAGARLYYVIFEWDKYYVSGDFGQTFINIIDLRSGGLGITGGIIVAVIYAYLYCKYKKVDLLKVFDMLAPGLLIAQAFGRWGNFFNQEAYGPVVENIDFMYKILPDFIMDGMFIGGKYYHPMFLYECLLNLVGVAIIFILRRKVKLIEQGDFIGFYLIWYGLVRAIIIEPYRMDPLMIGDLRINVIVPALFVILGISYIVVKHIKYPQKLYIDVVNSNETDKSIDINIEKTDNI